MNNKTNTRIATLKDLWEIFIHRLWIIVIATVVAIVGFYTVNKLTFEPQYTSTATIYILRQTDEEMNSTQAANDFTLSIKVVNDCTYLLKSKTVLKAVINELDLDSDYNALKASITTKNPEDTRILEVTVQADSPYRAKQIVDSVCTRGVACINEAMGYDQVYLYEKGDTIDTPSNLTGKLTYAVVGAVVAMLTYLVFLVKYWLDDTIKTDEDIEHYLGLSVLGEIPDPITARKKWYGYRKKKGNGYAYAFQSQLNSQTDVNDDGEN